MFKRKRKVEVPANPVKKELWPLSDSDGLAMLQCNGAVWIAAQKVDPKPSHVTTTELLRLLHG